MPALEASTPTAQKPFYMSSAYLDLIWNAYDDIRNTMLFVNGKDVGATDGNLSCCFGCAHREEGGSKLEDDKQRNYEDSTM